MLLSLMSVALVFFNACSEVSDCDSCELCVTNVLIQLAMVLLGPVLIWSYFPRWFRWKKWDVILPARLISGRRFSAARRGTVRFSNLSCSYGLKVPRRKRNPIRWGLGNVFGHFHGCFAWLGSKPETMPGNAFFCDEGNAEKMIWTNDGWVPWRAFCRGGAKPAKSEADLLQGLRELLAAYSAPTQQKGKGTDADTGLQKGKGKGPNQTSAPQKSKGTKPDPSSGFGKSKGKGYGKSKGPDPNAVSQKGKGKAPTRKVVPAGNDLLEALKRIVARADQDPAGLIQRLGSLVTQATAGKNLRPTRADRKARAKAKKGTTFDKGHIDTGTLVDPGHQGHKEQNSWVEVARKGSVAKHEPGPWRLDMARENVISVAEAQRKLQDDEPMNAQWIQAKDAREATRLLDIARVHDCKAKVGVVFQGCDDKLKSNRKQFPSVNKKGQKAIVSWNVVALAGVGPPEPQEAFILKSTFQAPQRKLRMLRVSIPKAFVEPSSWREVAINPQQYLCKHVDISWHSSQQWKIQELNQETVLQGYANLKSPSTRKPDKEWNRWHLLR
jgi:hypothetical protein